MFTIDLTDFRVPIFRLTKQWHNRNPHYRTGLKQPDLESCVAVLLNATQLNELQRLEGLRLLA